ncbi:MAG: hypothetical protein WA324_03275 [Bryobacteraceae bacterium]
MSPPASRWANFAREEDDVAREEDGGGYSGRRLIDGEIYTHEPMKKFLQKK